TAGCNPPANDRYCPGNNVTREQMSAFMHRLAVNQVVDAATAINADNADNADNAQLLDGKHWLQIQGAAASAAQSRSLVTPFFAPIVSIDDFNVPADGGALLIDASVLASRQASDQVGTVWIEVDLPGVPGPCDMGVLHPGYGVYVVSGTTGTIESVSVTGAVEISQGPHDIDLCHEGATSASVWLSGRMNVEWVPTIDGVGIAAGDGVTSSDVLAELAEQAGL
ncbi:MAG: hypothetical protein WCC01_01995, partial [Acidimicrobiia bacterium]